MTITEFKSSIIMLKFKTTGFPHMYQLLQNPVIYVFFSNVWSTVPKHKVTIHFSPLNSDSVDFKFNAYDKAFDFLLSKIND